MNHAKQLSQIDQQTLSMCLVPLVRMVSQELYVANEMSQAELQQHVLIQSHVLAIGAEIVTAQHAVEFLAQNLEQHVTATRGRNLVDREKIRPKTPGPHPLAILLVARFVYV